MMLVHFEAEQTPSPSNSRTFLSPQEVPSCLTAETPTPACSPRGWGSACVSGTVHSSPAGNRAARGPHLATFTQCFLSELRPSGSVYQFSICNCWRVFHCVWFVPSSVLGTFELFPVWGITSKAAMNICVSLCGLLFSFLPSRFLGMELLGHTVTLWLSFKETA